MGDVATNKSAGITAGGDAAATAEAVAALQQLGGKAAAANPMGITADAVVAIEESFLNSVLSREKGEEEDAPPPDGKMGKTPRWPVAPPH